MAYYKFNRRGEIIEMKSEYIRKFFNDHPPLMRELEKFIQEDNLLGILNSINEMRANLLVLRHSIQGDMVKIFRGEV